MTLERGTLLHKRYRIVEILGQGGMGSVYRAVDENLGVDIALKENLFTSDEYSRQFRLEAVILANLRHPNLPRVSDHFVVGDQGVYTDEKGEQFTGLSPIAIQGGELVAKNILRDRPTPCRPGQGSQQCDSVYAAACRVQES